MTIATHQQNTNRKRLQVAQSQIRAFALFCQSTSPALFTAGSMSQDDYSNLAKIEKFLKGVMVAVTQESRRVEQRDTGGNL